MRRVSRILAATLLAAAAGFPAGAAEPKRGGTLTYTFHPEPTSLSTIATTAVPVALISTKIFESLLEYEGPELKPVAGLAESWTVSDDAKTYTFKLRAAKWHDGKPFTSEDVKWSLTEGLAGNARSAAIIKLIKSIDTPSPTQVKFTLTKPYAPFLIQMKVFDAPILPKHVFGTGDMKTNPASRAPIGTGPFKFSEWKSGQSITLVKNPNYFEQGQPKLDSVIFRIVSEPQNRINAIITGEADILPAMFLPTANIKDLEGKPDIEIHKQIALPALYFMQMNTAKPELGKVEVRQAIAQAIDRPRIVEQAMGGLAKPGYGSFGEGFEWMVNKDSSYDTLYPLDPNAAKQKLAAAGVGSATLRLAFDGARPQFRAAAEIIKDNLAGVGITVSLEPMEASVYKEKVYAKRDFDLALQSFTSSGDPAIGYHRMYVTNPEHAINRNATGYGNAEVDSLLSNAGQVPAKEQRAESYRKAQAILDRDVPTFVLFDELQADVSISRVGGLYAEQNPSGQYGQVFVKQ